MVDDANWKGLGIFTWDRETNTILGSMNTNGERPDHVSMSPSGSHCVVASDGAIGTAAYTRDTKLWMHQKIFALQLKKDPNIYNLAHHRVSYKDYSTAPVATVNRDFTKVLFNSNWGTKSDVDIDAYMVEIPANVIKP
jgi:hypothetical protein